MLALEDYALKLENQHKILVGYDALHEAYRLSQKYISDEAMPGKAITLLERSASFTDNSVLTKKSVQQCIEQSTGIKVADADQMEVDKLLNLEDLIHERMIDQAQAVTAVASTLRRARAGVSSQNRPLGSFLFLGPTGVGKTELAKSLAATYFNDETNMIRIDMSEYQQGSDVERLLNDGSDKSSSLIMQARQKPFSVILLDEVEKAHPNILNLLLQLLDEGQLTDLNGRKVSFRESIIIATSNAGAAFISEQIEQQKDVANIKDQLIDQLIKEATFKPELINRFDDIVIFKPLEKPELTQVVNLLLAELNKNLALQNISVELSSEAVDYIVETGYDPRLGARPMRRTLQKAVEDTLAKKILTGEAKPGSHIILNLEDLKPNQE
jgi:ATP-dependent Clp protease ATP-binding subunit ClpA